MGSLRGREVPEEKETLQAKARGAWFYNGNASRRSGFPTIHICLENGRELLVSLDTDIGEPDVMPPSGETSDLLRIA